MKRLLFLFAMLLPMSAFAAFHAGTAWDVRATATDANGGGGFRNKSSLAAPSAPSLSCPTTGGTVAAGTYYVVVNYVDAHGNEGPASSASTCTATGSTSSIVTTSPAASARAVYYRVYMSATNLPGPWWANPGTDVAIGTDSTRTTTPATSGTQPVGQSDYSQQNSVQVAYTDIVIGGTTTTATSAAVPFLPSMVGNVINITAGTGCTVQRVQITAVSAANVATFEKSLGTATSTCTGGLGGSLQSLSAAALLTVAGNAVFAKGGSTYSETLAITVGGGTGTPITFCGYNSTHLDNPTAAQRPLIDGGGVRANGITVGSLNGIEIVDINVTGATADNVSLAGNVAVMIRNMRSYAAGDDGIFIQGASAQGTFINIEADANSGCGVRTLTGGSAAALFLYGAYIHDNTSYGVCMNPTGNAGTSGGIFRSIVESNSDHNVLMSFNSLVVESTIYNAIGASSDGIHVPTLSSPHAAILNSTVTGNGRYGISRAATTTINTVSINNNVYGNSTANYFLVTPGVNDVSLDPQFVDAAGGNFAIGTNLKGLGWPGVFPGGLSTGYLDIGAVQRQEPSAGGGLPILGGSVVK